jgi:hypothetical protein
MTQRFVLPMKPKPLYGVDLKISKIEPHSEFGIAASAKPAN